jgi:hypothetical protein
VGSDFANDVKEMESRQRRKSGKLGSASPWAFVMCRDNRLASMITGAGSDKRAKHNAQIHTDTLKELYSSLHALLQHLCARVPEKADYRAYAGKILSPKDCLLLSTDASSSRSTGEALVHIFGLLPNKERPRFINFLTKYVYLAFPCIYCPISR